MQIRSQDGDSLVQGSSISPIPAVAPSSSLSGIEVRANIPLVRETSSQQHTTEDVSPGIDGFGDGDSPNEEQRRLEDLVRGHSQHPTESLRHLQAQIRGAFFPQGTPIARSAEPTVQEPGAAGAVRAESGIVMRVRVELQQELRRLTDLAQQLSRLDLPASDEDSRRRLKEDFLRQAKQLRGYLNSLNQPLNSAQLTRLQAYAAQSGLRNTLREAKLQSLDIHQTLGALDELLGQTRQARNNVKLQTLPPERRAHLGQDAEQALRARYPGGNYTHPQRILDGEPVNGVPFFQGDGIVLFQRDGLHNPPVVQVATTAQLAGRPVTIGKPMRFIAGSTSPQDKGRGRKRS